jgi:hypothetical protein
MLSGFESVSHPGDSNHVARLLRCRLNLLFESVHEPVQHINVPLTASPNRVAKLCAMANGASRLMQQFEKAEFKSGEPRAHGNCADKHLMRGCVDNEWGGGTARWRELLRDLFKSRPIDEAQLKWTDGEGSAGFDAGAALNRLSIDLDAVATVEVGQLVLAVVVLKTGVEAGDENVIEDDIAVRVPSDHRDVPVEQYQVSLPVAGRYTQSHCYNTISARCLGIGQKWRRQLPPLLLYRRITC